MQKSKPFENFKNVIIIYKISLFQFIKYNCFVYKLMKGSQREGTIPTKPRSRSVPDVTDTKFSARDRTAH